MRMVWPAKAQKSNLARLSKTLGTPYFRLKLISRYILNFNEGFGKRMHKTCGVQHLQQV